VTLQDLQAGAPTPDSLRALIDTVLAGAEYQVRDLTDPWAPIRRAWFALLEWIDALRASSPLGYRVLIWTLIAILGAIVVHAAWIAARTLRAGTARPPTPDVPEPSAIRDSSWYAREAQRLANAGEFVKAMQYDFLRLILELDAREVTRFHPSKNPIEYGRDARMEPEVRREFRQLIHRLYAHAFARVPVTPADWDAWRHASEASRYAPTH
jgi:hypothetical protein